MSTLKARRRTSACDGDSIAGHAANRPARRMHQWPEVKVSLAIAFTVAAAGPAEPIKTQPTEQPPPPSGNYLIPAPPPPPNETPPASNQPATANPAPAQN